MIEGLAGDRWALISKVHHCMVDGVSATDLYRVIFDFSPEPSPPAAADDRTVGAEPSPLSLAAQAALDIVVLPVREAFALSGIVAHDPGAAIRQAAGTVRAIAKLAPALWPATGSSLSGQIGQQRRYTWARASLDDVKKIKRELGGTVNDVVLAAISGGFRALLLARGEQPEPHMVRSLVPVSVRAVGEENIYENRVSAMLADLPVHIADPVRTARGRPGRAADPEGGQGSDGGRGPGHPGPLHPVPAHVLAGSGWRSRCRSGRSSPSPPMCPVPVSRSTGWAADSWRSSPTCRSPPRSAPGSRSSATAATSPSGSPATSPPTPTSTCWPGASRTV